MQLLECFTILFTGTRVAIVRVMECFFAACPLPEQNDLGKSAIVQFNIPDIGIRFKAPFDAVDPNHGDLASLLALLEFIDSNQKYFTNRAFQIFGTNLAIINMLNGRQQVDERFEHLLEKAKTYRAKYHFSLSWIPAKENTAFESLLD
jgi:hypothetical protein